MLLANLTVEASTVDPSEMAVSIGHASLKRVAKRPHTHSRRDVYTDANLAVAVKIEHSSTDREPYQCWNEYTIWNEYARDTEIAQYLAPSLELGALACPIHQGCVLSVNVQEYIDDGYPRTLDYKRPYKDCMFGALRGLQGLGLHLSSDVREREWQQVVYSLEREHFVLVDYGLVAGAAGVRLTSRSRPDGFWGWVRRALKLTG